MTRRTSAHRGLRTPQLLFALTALVAVMMVPIASRAQWIYNGNPINTEAEDQLYATVAGDGQGGVFVSWTRSQNANNYDLYLQRVTGYGMALWGENGIAVSTAVNFQFKPALVADDSGGVYIAWEDNRSGNYDIYAQHFDADGAERWEAGGRVICNDAANQGGTSSDGPRIVRSDAKDDIDGDGPGVIIAWDDFRPGPGDIYAQRVVEKGVVWAANGIPICADSASQNYTQMVSDGNNGAIIAWRDSRAGLGNEDIYAQRVNRNGTTLWTADGEPVCTAANDQQKPRIATDGAGGAIISWIDRRISLVSPFNVYAQRMDGTGNPQWTADGVNVHTFSEYDDPEIVSDGAGGCVITWRDPRNGTPDIFAQRLNSSGVKQWTALGETVTNRAGDNRFHKMCPDGSGGAYVVWENGGFPVLESYIQHVDNTGTMTFPLAGQLVTNAPDRQSGPAVCVDGAEPAFVAWSDHRNTPNDPDLYLTRVYHTVSDAGDPGEAPALSPISVRVSPNPFGATTEVSITASRAGELTIAVYDVTGRRVAERAVHSDAKGYAAFTFDGRGADGALLPAGVYLLRVRGGGAEQTVKMVLTR